MGESIEHEADEYPSREPGSLAPSRDDIWKRVPGAKGPGGTSAGSDRPERERPREPAKRRPDLRRLRGVVLSVGAIVLAFVFQALGHDSKPEQPEPPAVHPLGSNPEVRAYLTRVQAICRRHDRQVEASGQVPIDAIVRSETGVTSRIAAVPAPSGAREMRHTLLRARHRVDEITARGYRLMSRSSDPAATFERRIAPVVRTRVARMYETFGSFGIHCNAS